jgi:ATP-dependent RNA circularization protein (DNA/RNA ligase family)
LIKWPTQLQPIKEEEEVVEDLDVVVVEEVSVEEARVMLPLLKESVDVVDVEEEEEEETEARTNLAVGSLSPSWVVWSRKS